MPLLPLTEWPALVNRLLAIGTGFATVMAVAVVVERLAFARLRHRQRQLETRYLHVIRRALAGDPAAVTELARCPRRRRLELAAILIEPLIDDRDPVRIARTRAVIDAMAIVPIADAYLRSRWGWRRAMALRVLGMSKITERTPQLIAALDDANADVRAAALDALRDLGSREALNAIIVHLNDPSLHSGRRAAALMAFGSECEPLVLELGRLHPPERARYARALTWCGSSRSRATLLEWTHDPRPEVQAASLEALARVGLDEVAARRALECLEHDDARVRGMAAQALRGWGGCAHTAAQLARHLDDVWSVAVRSAYTLRSMRPDGLDALRGRAVQDGIAGTLARQMLWEERLTA